MAELDSYVTGVGPYPTAPNTSVQQFLSEHPEYTNGSSGGNKWWSDIANVVSAGQEYPALNVHYRDYLSFRRQYDDWVNGKTNEYNALVKTWEAAQKSPLNESELLEAAGYNRNWLQGAANSGVDSSGPINPMLSRSGEGSADPMASIFSILQQSQAIVDTVLEARQKMADINKTETETETMQEMLPFRQIGPYMKGIKEYNEIYGRPKGDFTYFPITPNSGITFNRWPEQSYYNTMLNLRKDMMYTQELGLRLNNQQKSQVVHTLLPLQAEIYRVQKSLLDGQLSMQNFEKKLREITQPALEKYSPKMISQQYISNWVKLAVNSSVAVGRMIFDINKFGMNFGLDWMKSTGEVLPGMPGN